MIRSSCSVGQCVCVCVCVCVCARACEVCLAWCIAATPPYIIRPHLLRMRTSLPVIQKGCGIARTHLNFLDSNPHVTSDTSPSRPHARDLSIQPLLLCTVQSWGRLRRWFFIIACQLNERRYVCV